MMGGVDGLDGGRNGCMEGGEDGLDEWREGLVVTERGGREIGREERNGECYG
jgi:hypothetical protein